MNRRESCISNHVNGPTAGEVLNHLRHSHAVCVEQGNVLSAAFYRSFLRSMGREVNTIRAGADDWNDHTVEA